MENVETIVGLLAAVAVLVTLSRRVSLPYPLVLVLGGLVLGFLPGLPRVALPPELVLLVFLPPLLYSEALLFSWRDFKANLRPIGLLAFGLVFLTTAIVAVAAHAVTQGLPWGACAALGAIVAPTDAVAASAIAKSLRLPRRILTILTGESLVNDAAALVVYRLSVAAVVTGRFSAGEAAGQFLLSGLGGVVLGLAAGAAIGWVRGRMQPDPPVENTISLLTPFAAYLPAEACHVSGVLAVVTAGLYLGRIGPRIVSAPTRLQAGAIWQMLDFLLNGLLFILVGLQLHSVLAGVAGHHPLRLLMQAGAVSLAVILARIVWVFPATYLPRLASRRLRERDPLPDRRSVLVVAWAGMRGGISLAAALALPLAVGGGSPFPGRDLLIFLTFSVILSTLVVQGLSLPLLIRRLGLHDDGNAGREEREAQVRASQAALDHLDALVGAEDLPAEVVADLRSHVTQRMRRFESRADAAEKTAEETTEEAQGKVLRRLHREIVDIKRRTVIGLRDDGTIGDTVLQRLQRTLDLEEQRLTLDGDDREA